MKKTNLLFILCLCLMLLVGCSANQNDADLGLDTADRVAYSDANNWLALPDGDEFGVDVIYFYPTAFSPKDGESTECTIDDENMRIGAQSIYQGQATAFETVGNMYAPYYRQIDAMTLAGKNQEEMIEAESGNPKTDVFDALDYYFQNYNEGKPYILAGHSQGAMMIYLILDEYMEEHPEYYKNMIAAYMIGNAATTDWLEKNPHVKMAQKADDTGVVVSWNTEGNNNIGHYNMVVPENAVCINPLNWRTDDQYAGVEENKGSLIDGKIEKGIADAQINLERGSVICTTVDPVQYANSSEVEQLFGPESYHGWDYGFYYENIRENAQLRAEAFAATSSLY